MQSLVERLGFCFFNGIILEKKIKTYVYIDGFNLYYGSLKKSPYKWLNPYLLCQNILSSKNEIESIKYFTASVSARDNDPGMPMRQSIYFRALRTIDCLEIIEGHYLTHKKTMKIAEPPKLYKNIENPMTLESRYHEVEFANVVSTEEKGSDVNLATHLLLDAFDGKFDVAVIISNDSDLATPVGITRNRFNKKVIILNPHSKNKASIQLAKFSTKVIQISSENLSESLFKDSLSDNIGTFTKPASW